MRHDTSTLLPHMPCLTIEHLTESITKVIPNSVSPVGHSRHLSTTALRARREKCFFLLASLVFTSSLVRFFILSLSHSCDPLQREASRHSPRTTRNRDSKRVRGARSRDERCLISSSRTCAVLCCALLVLHYSYSDHAPRFGAKRKGG